MVIRKKCHCTPCNDKTVHVGDIFREVFRRRREMAVKRRGDPAGSFASAHRIPPQFKVSAEADSLLCEFPALNIKCRRASNKDTTKLTKQKLRYVSVHTTDRQTDSELERFTLETELMREWKPVGRSPLRNRFGACISRAATKETEHWIQNHLNSMAVQHN